MKQSTTKYVSNRVLKLNVGFLLSSGPGHTHDTAFDAPAVRVSDDVLVQYVRGPLRLSRTKEGILVRGWLQLGVLDECYRCLDSVPREIKIELEELFAYQTPTITEFNITDAGIIDLAPLIRAEVLIADTRGVLCRPDCAGLCPDCGINLNHATCDCEANRVDPRLAKLKELLD
ncbi:MAG: DUF177 domain-containing protein [Burkholderiales bacterium]|nr:DUF177 domain-containing protein [Anaerolineae bacterium]